MPYAADNRLPGEAPGVTRWTPGRKQELLERVRDGRMTIEDACSRFAFTAEEIASWDASLQRHGTAGLRCTRIQHYREQPAHG